MTANVRCTSPDGYTAPACNVPRFTDATGREVDALARYRALAALEERGDYAAAERLRADEAAAIEADGWRYVHVGGGRLDYRRAEEAERLGLPAPMAAYYGIGPAPLADFNPG